MPATPHPIDLAGCTMPAGRADVAELAYALDSKSSGREVMRVQLPPSAPLPQGPEPRGGVEAVREARAPLAVQAATAAAARARGGLGRVV